MEGDARVDGRQLAAACLSASPRCAVVCVLQSALRVYNKETESYPSDCVSR